jgi:hypothetical protein
VTHLGTVHPAGLGAVPLVVCAAVFQHLEPRVEVRKLSVSYRTKRKKEKSSRAKKSVKLRKYEPHAKHDKYLGR